MRRQADPLTTVDHRAAITCTCGARLQLEPEQSTLRNAIPSALSGRPPLERSTLLAYVVHSQAGCRLSMQGCELVATS